jgi:hypothetical protein
MEFCVVNVSFLLVVMERSVMYTKGRGIVNVGELQAMKLGVPSTDRYTRLDSWLPDIGPS